MKTVTNRGHATKKTIKVGGREHGIKVHSWGAVETTFGPLRGQTFPTRAALKAAMEQNTAYA